MNPEQRPATPHTLGADVLSGVALFLAVAAAVFGWLTIGPDNPVYAIIFALLTFGLGPWLGKLPEHHLPQRWFRTHPKEKVFLSLLGVPAFGVLLERSGWNRVIADPMRSFDGTRADLPNLERHLRGGMSAHGTAFILHLGISLLAAVTGHLWGALWILLPGLVLHLYPVLLQRWIRLRAEPLFARCVNS